MLPEYQAIDFDKQHFPTVLKESAQALSFPLTEQDIADIRLLETKYDQEENCAGLAAPQIGIAKK